MGMGKGMLDFGLFLNQGMWEGFPCFKHVEKIDLYRSESPIFNFSVGQFWCSAETEWGVSLHYSKLRYSVVTTQHYTTLHPCPRSPGLARVQSAVIRRTMVAGRSSR